MRGTSGRIETAKHLVLKTPEQSLGSERHLNASNITTTISATVVILADESLFSGDAFKAGSTEVRVHALWRVESRLIPVLVVKGHRAIALPDELRHDAA